MTKDDANLIGFEIVAYSGEARSKLLLALEKAKKKEFEECDVLVKEAQESLVDAHKVQTKMLQDEASGEQTEVGFIMMHAQDHLMTTLLLQDIIQNLFDIYKN